ncbi:hypothetical protein BGP_6515 [Beggiatoa sp. PS]|nr:hypothetical protein BGP_6515 [Beggiatoa sp. PS]
MVYLNNSQVSTSVQEGVGNGGDLTINGSQFVIMNNGQIIAQANEGNGGNIRFGSQAIGQITLQSNQCLIKIRFRWQCAN